MEDIQGIITEYGWIGVLVWLLIREIIPWMRQVDTRRHEMELQERADQKEREARTIEALDSLSKVLGNMDKTHTLISDRMCGIEENQKGIATTLTNVQTTLLLMEERMGHVERDQHDIHHALSLIAEKIPGMCSVDIPKRNQGESPRTQRTRTRRNPHERREDENERR
jgi:hypothetical protein